MAPPGVIWALFFVPLLILVVQLQLATAVIRKMAAEEDVDLAPLTFEEALHDVTLGNDRIKITLGKGGLRGLRGSIRTLDYQTADGKEVQLLQDIAYGDGKDKFPGYWDMHWYDGFSAAQSANHNSKCSFGQASRTILTEAESDEGFKDEMLGVTYKQEMKAHDSRKSTPLNTMVHYSVRKDVAGIYCTLMLDHTRFDPAMLLAELRLVLMLNPKLFDYSYIADDRQRFMHTRKDISKHASSRLAFKEARILTKPENMSHYGEVDHKYIHSVESKDATLYGWISTKMGIGVWIISPNKWEYLGGGLTKQELSVQTGPKLLAMLHSRHYGTPLIELEDGEEWKKVFGPFLIYVNEAPTIEGLVHDAKDRAAKETQSWPYKWVPFADYTSRESRGLVVGRLLKGETSSNLNETKKGLGGVSVGLTDERSSTSNWEVEVKNYQYWNTTDEDGQFAIYGVRPGKYILQTVVHGFLVDSSVLHVVAVKENWVSDVGDVVLRSVQKGPTVWEIGYPDRSATEFMVPEGSSLSSSSGNKDAFRQYGLWQKYWELYPDEDPVFTIGKSDWSKDWFFAHILTADMRSSQREISFTLSAVVRGDYTLRIAIAGAHQAALEIRVNEPNGTPLFDTGPFGKDNALARAGIHGQYHEFSVSLSHMNFRPGQNSIFIRQRRKESRFNYVMYDYLLLEEPARVAAPTLQFLQSI